MTQAFRQTTAGAGSGLPQDILGVAEAPDGNTLVSGQSYEKMKWEGKGRKLCPYDQEMTTSNQKAEHKKKGLEHWQVIALYLVIYDVIAVNAAYFLGLWFRFDCTYSAIPGEYLSAYLKFAPWYTAFSILVFWVLRLYNSVWRFASYSELLRVALSTVLTFLFQTIGITVAIRRMPMSYYLFGTIIQFCLIVGIRFSYRFILLERTRRQKEEEGPLHHVMIIGAGQAGQIILRDIERAKEQKAKVCCVI